MQRLQYNLRVSAAKRNIIPHAAAAARNLAVAVSTAICTNWIAQHIRIATHYCRTHRFDAAVPMHKVSQHMQTTIALRQLQKRKSHLEPSVPLCARFEQHSTLKGRRLTPWRARANFSPQGNLHLPEQTQCFVQILAFKSQPWCSSSNAICQQWLAKHIQNRKPSLKNKYLNTLRAALVSTLLYSTLLDSTQPLPLLDFYSTSTSASTPTLLVLCSALLYSSTLPLYSILLYSSLLFSTLLCSTLLFPTPPCYTLLYSSLVFSTLLYSALLYSSLLYSASTLPLLYSASTLHLLYLYPTSTLRYLYSTSSLLHAGAHWTQWSLG